MKKYIIIYLVLFSAITLYSKELRDIENPSILIYLHTQGKQLTSVGIKLVNDIESKLKRRLPCVRITTIVDILKMMEEDRAKSIADENYKSNMEEISKKFNNPFYVLHFNVLDLGNAYSINGKFGVNSCKDWTDFNPISENLSYGGDLEEISDKFTDGIAKELLEKGICPFKGELMIENTLTMNDLRETQFNNNCGFSKTEKTTDNASKWTFKKLGRSSYETRLEDKVLIEEWWFDKSTCVNCSQLDDEGNVIGIFTEKSSTTMSQLKQESGNHNLKADSSVITFIFNNDNTYMINVVAVCPNSLIKDVRIEKEDTQCQRKSKDLINYNKVYLKSNIINTSYGPFIGNIFDKELKLPLKKEVIKYANDKEVITNSIEFSFSR